MFRAKHIPRKPILQIIARIIALISLASHPRLTNQVDQIQHLVNRISINICKHISYNHHQDCDCLVNFPIENQTGISLPNPDDLCVTCTLRTLGKNRSTIGWIRGPEENYIQLNAERDQIFVLRVELYFYYMGDFTCYSEQTIMLVVALTGHYI